MNNPDHISEILDIIFWVKILKFFDADSGSEMGKNSDLGSVINILDPQHWSLFDPRMILPMSALTALIFCSGTVFQILAMRTMALASMIPYPKEWE
jgi:hypothetical protein